MPLPAGRWGFATCLLATALAFATPVLEIEDATGAAGTAAADDGAGGECNAEPWCTPAGGVPVEAVAIAVAVSVAVAVAADDDPSVPFSATFRRATPDSAFSATGFDTVVSTTTASFHNRPVSVHRSFVAEMGAAAEAGGGGYVRAEGRVVAADEGGITGAKGRGRLGAAAGGSAPSLPFPSSGLDSGPECATSTSSLPGPSFPGASPLLSSLVVVDPVGDDDFLALAALELELPWLASAVVVGVGEDELKALRTPSTNPGNHDDDDDRSLIL